MRARRSLSRLLPAAALALLLAGCGGPTGPGATVVEGSSDLAFARPPQGRQDGAEVAWTFWVRNNATTPSAPATLQATVSFSGSRAPAQQVAQEVPSIPPGTVEVVELRTAYRGLGDYFGAAELLVGPRVATRAPLFYEQCGPGALRAMC